MLPVTIHLTKCYNIIPAKGDTFSVLLRLEHASKLLDDSARIEGRVDQEIDFNYSTIIEVTQGNTESIGNILETPLVINVMEVLPTKDKKSKEDNTVLIGQGCIDFLPLFHGKTSFSDTLTISNNATSQVIDDQQPIMIEYSVTTPGFLIPQNKCDNYTLMRLRVHSLYSPPDQWATNPLGTSFLCSFPVPPNQNSTKDALLINNGSYRPKPSKDTGYDNHLRFSNLINVSPSAAIIPDSYVESSIPEDEYGDLRDKPCIPLRREAETNKSRVVWNYERRYFMDINIISEMKRTLTECEERPLEVIRSTPQVQQKGVKGGKTKEEETSYSYHGVAYVNLSPLLYPGAMQLTGAYLMHPYNEQEVISRTQCQISFILGSRVIKSRSSSGKPPANTKNLKKSSSSFLTPIDQNAPNECSIDNSTDQESIAYTENKSYIHINIELSKPLIPRRTPTELASYVCEMIPPRPSLTPRMDGADKALHNYHQQINHVATGLLNEIWCLYGDQLATLDNIDTQKKKLDLQYQLNITGKFHAMKEQLKHAVVQIVREKYLNKTSFQSQSDLEEFISELYVYLIDQMHTGLQNTFTKSQYDDSIPSVASPALLKLFACEAESCGNYSSAAYFYQQRIAMTKNSSDYWCDYGAFCLLINDIMKAEECYKQAISIDQENALANAMYGMVCYLNSREKDAELFLESSVSLQSQSIYSWVLLGLYYEAMANRNSMEMSFRRAEAVLNLDLPKLLIAPMKTSNSKLSLISKDLRQSQSSRDGLMVGKFMGGTTEFNERIQEESSQDLNEENVLDEEGKKQEPSLAQGGTVERTSTSQTSLHSALESEAHGDVTIQQLSSSANQQANQQQSIFLVTAEFLIERNSINFCEMSLAHHLNKFPENLGTNYYTLNSRLNLLKGDYESAVHNAKEAIRYDVENPKSWECLANAQYYIGSDVEACSNYERILALFGDPCNLHVIYYRLASLYLKQNKFEKAKKTFLLGCNNSATALMWLGVGVACYRLDEITEAEDALAEANILNNLEADIWAYLCLVCLKTKRYSEAEQTLKFALKCGLKDKQLLSEIETLKNAEE